MNTIEIPVVDAEVFIETVKKFENVEAHEIHNMLKGHKIYEINSGSHDLFLLGMQYQLDLTNKRINPKLYGIDKQEQLMIQMIDFIESMGFDGVVMESGGLSVNISIKGDFINDEKFHSIQDSLHASFEEYIITKFSAVHLPEVNKTSMIITFKSK